MAWDLPWGIADTGAHAKSEDPRQAVDEVGLLMLGWRKSVSTKVEGNSGRETPPGGDRSAHV